ncbi:hypothetical protein VTJ04DRAFT_6683 [Mycothermus thermophilus]|uniref:uncharacterized protein n=1 Tax=Humicola insolens TaxID=85995 RepID=UPI003743004E
MSTICRQPSAKRRVLMYCGRKVFLGPEMDEALYVGPIRSVDSVASPSSTTWLWCKRHPAGINEKSPHAAGRRCRYLVLLAINWPNLPPRQKVY